MNCQSTTETVTSCSNCGSNDNGFLIIIVLYILLAIILGSRCNRGW